MARRADWHLACTTLEDRLAFSVSIQFDYRYDTAGFFDIPERRDALARAAADLTDNLSDTLSAITPSGGDSWVAQFQRPDSGEIVQLANLVVPEDVVVVFVGSQPLPGSAVAANLVVTPAFRATGSRAWRDLVESRGELGVLDSVPSDTAPWGGSVVFDQDQDWFFGADPADNSTRADFQSTATHEFMHLFGFADSNLAFRRWVEPNFTFTGPASVAEYGGPVPTDEVAQTNSAGEFVRAAPSHWNQEVLSRGLAPLMRPASFLGDREFLSPLDLAALEDVGWETGTPPAANTPPTVTDVADLRIPPGGTSGPIAFTVTDAETPATTLTVTATSGAPGVGVTLGGAGESRSVTASATAGFTGTATVTLTVTDEGGLTATDTFVVTVAPGPPVPPPPPVPPAVPPPPAGPSVPPAPRPLTPPVGSPPANPTPPANPLPPAVPPTVPPVVPDEPVLAPLEGPPREFAVGGDRGSGRVQFFNPDRSVRFAGNLFGDDFTGGVRAATADFDRDGVADLIVGTGPGRPTRVLVLSGNNLRELFAVDPFESAFTGGVYVAAGDVTGDGVPDLVVTPDEGGGPRVRVFSGVGFAPVADFFGIDDPAFRGGARAAVGDLNGDGVGDLLVAAGFGGGPRVAGFDGATLTGARTRVFGDFFAFEQTLRNGVYLASGDVDGDGFADVIAGGGPGGGPRVSVFDGFSLLTGEQVRAADFFAGDPAERGGARVAIKTLDGDPFADLLVGAGTGAGNRVTAYAGAGLIGSEPPEAFDFDALGGFRGGVFVG